MAQDITDFLRFYLIKYQKFRLKLIKNVSKDVKSNLTTFVNAI